MKGVPREDRGGYGRREGCVHVGVQREDEGVMREGGVDVEL